MNRRHALRAAGAIALAPWGVASAQTPDVPYVVTPWSVVDAILKLAAVRKGDYVVDLGSGDGRIVIAAATRFGAGGFGVDMDSTLVGEAQREARRQGVADRAAFYTRDLFITDFGKATVLTMYLSTRINVQLRERLFRELKPGARVVSHEFDMGDWRHDERVRVAVPDKPYGPPSSEVYLWIVPANAAGTWQWRLDSGGAPLACEAALEQTFQMLGGRAVVGGRAARIDDGRMRGEEIRFMLTAELSGRETRLEFAGQVAGDAIAGRVRASGGTEAPWSATRVGRGSIKLG